MNPKLADNTNLLNELRRDGILGLIGWAYLVASMAFLLFRGHLLGAAVLLLCLYPADRTGTFQNFWLANHVDIGETLGSQASVTVAGLLLVRFCFPQTWPRPGLESRCERWA